MTSLTALLKSWIDRQLAAESRGWLDEKLAAISAGDRKALFLTFGLIPRKLGKADLQLTPDDLAVAETLRPEWNPRGWSVDQAARALLVLSVAALDSTAYVAMLDQMFNAAEMGELIALYQALPLLPFPDAHRLRCAEGMRSNIKAVFLAIAHNNPYPAEQLNEERWNQLVLKCLFIAVPLDPVIGLDRRANATLARNMVDYAHERWAAGRLISPEIWRCVGPFYPQIGKVELEKVLTTGREIEQQAAALALTLSNHAAATELLQSVPQLQSAIRAGSIGWNTIAANAYETV